ncbi:hypothetical protein FKW77_008383 [Venturia effusa]|uniref:Uncharacterized protein n=1 Tax=Venturia effusa TaxID=50376 RepID=A0A517L5X9_9PEZI|nr:hypothetical protein FKW77_008383 [Venturia effusa]
MERRIEDARVHAAAQALAGTGEEMVRDTAIPEPKRQRDECWMLLMKALHLNAKAPFTTSDLEKLTLRNGIPLLMLPNGWAHVNEIAISQYGLRDARCQNWTMRPEFAAVYIWNLTESELSREINHILDHWNPDNLMKPREEDEFHQDVAALQEYMVYKTVAERVGVLSSQIDDHMKAKIENVVPVIQSYLRAGEPDPFKVAEIQRAITELRGDPFAMDAMRLLVEDLSFEANDAFSIDQLTAILGELNVASEVANGSGAMVAESERSHDVDKEDGSVKTPNTSPGEAQNQGSTLIE